MASAIAEASSVLLVRAMEPLEIFAVRRSEKLRFFGGFVAFPGGKLAANDADAPVVMGSSASSPARVVTAARELFEETGILLARQRDGSFPPSSPELERQRRDVNEGVLTFGQILKDRGLEIRSSDFEPLGRLITPEFTSTRFDTAFFLANVPPRQHAEVWPGELQDGFWSTPAALLNRWNSGELMISPPSVAILQALKDCPRADASRRLAALFHQLDTGRIHPIFFAPATQMIPLKTHALPPSTHTNAYLVGTGPVYLLDPGSSDPAEQAKLFQVLDDQRETGRPVTAIILTHQHPDHIGAANAVAKRYGVPIWAHARTAELLAGKTVISRTIGDGADLDLGPLPVGGGRWHFRAIHTPGHASGHLAFFEPRYGLLFAGDMVSTQTSIVIAPPDGDLAVYLDSLRLLERLPARLLLPAHGSPTSRSRATIEEALEHRRKREEILLATLAEGPKTVLELAAILYRGVPTELMRFAGWQVQAGLTKLQREGRVFSKGEGPTAVWRLSP